MTTVIRGVIPHISASTVKHSERDLTFLFTDIRGFTSLCEGQSPEAVVETLNHYLDIQSSVILANGGDIDKFVGDEIMAMFEGSKKELNACKPSLEIRRAMAEEKKIAELAERNVISIGIGINTGPVVFGSVGAKDRMDFTSIGGTVNLAARLEGANKTCGTKTLITEAVHDKVKESYLCREIDLLTVKGKRQPVRIFEILQAREGSPPTAGRNGTSPRRPSRRSSASSRTRRAPDFDPLASARRPTTCRANHEDLRRFEGLCSQIGDAICAGALLQTGWRGSV